MDINQFSIYSKILVAESAENEIFDEVLKEIRKIKENTTADAVIEYLQENYGVDKTTRQFYIRQNIPVKINNSSNSLSIHISVADREILYFFNKDD
ncbi:MAG: hypothetical protein NC408_01430 [Candidatus Gastranaerophilales bacterium]|nr:hypothetical protein [Candidatus Gastranaerophilales bacterium]MCM1072220.1 hypothetical protein [Bacteroides sp.]